MLEIEEKVNHLDELMAQLIQTVDRTSKEMRRSYEHSQRDMQDFREEMRLSHENFEREMRLSREKSEREMHEFKTEMRQSKRDLDKKWGALSNKLGTMAEDLVAPSIQRILKQLTGCSAEIEYSAVRVHKSKPQNQEFDVVVKCEWIFINETKSTLRPEHIDNFHRLMQNIRDYFPEFKENQFIENCLTLCR
ncbi:MAG: hypothetical protein R3E08_10610 [Thiotrichaceae bacterium]